MHYNIPEKVLFIYRALEQHEFQVYLVGGSVRNLLLNKEVKDWDLTTNATPEDLLKLFPNGFYDNQFGTVGVPVEINGQQKVVEITTFRRDLEYTDRRRPSKVEWGKTIEEDLERRDFTINAIAMQCHPGMATTTIGSQKDAITSFQHDNFQIIDPFHGQKDLEQKIIRAVGDPNLRFKEDALRLMRAVRLASELSFTIEEKTWQAISDDAPLLKEISGERIRMEFLRILASNYPYEGVMLLKNAGILEVILPELTSGIGVSQVRPGRHHTTDVFTHNVLSLKFCPSPDPIVRFATLLHDVGKPQVENKDEHGLVTFYNHEIIGARIVKDICDRLHFSKKDREKIVTLIRWHMFSVNEELSDAGVRRFIRRIGVDNVKDMMDLRVGDRLGGGTQTAESWRLKLFKKKVEEQLRPAPFSIKDLAVSGNDIMKELGIKPGPKVGEILQKLFEEVDEDLSKNNSQYLLNRIKELYKN